MQTDLGQVAGRAQKEDRALAKLYSGVGDEFSKAIHKLWKAATFQPQYLDTALTMQSRKSCWKVLVAEHHHTAAISTPNHVPVTAAIAAQGRRVKAVYEALLLTEAEVTAAGEMSVVTQEVETAIAEGRFPHTRYERGGGPGCFPEVEDGVVDPILISRYVRGLPSSRGCSPQVWPS